MRKPAPPRIVRRQALGGLGVLGAGLAACGSDRSNMAATPSAADEGGGGACTLTPEQTEGPFFVASPERSDIRAGRPGALLELDLRVVEARTCAPLAGITVELWHADAAGVYSAFGVEQGNTADATGQDFLRGSRPTDAEGRVAFSTVYPGWYPGRTPHLHVKIVSQSGDDLLITQLYFPEAVTDAVYAAEPYSARGPRDTTNATDAASGRQAAALLLSIDATGSALRGEFELGVNV